jgi:hypothetical protein
MVCLASRVQVAGECKCVYVNAGAQAFCPSHPHDLHQLVCVIVAIEKGLLAKDHGGKHAAQAPHVQAVVVLLCVRVCV